MNAHDDAQDSKRNASEEKEEEGAEKTERPARRKRDPRDMHPTGTTEQLPEQTTEEKLMHRTRRHKTPAN